MPSLASSATVSLILAALGLGLSACDEGAVDDGGRGTDLDGGALDGPPPPDPNGIPDQRPPPQTYKIDNNWHIEIPSGGKVSENAITPLKNTHITGNLRMVTTAYTFNLAQASINVVESQGNVLKLSGTAKVTMPALHTFSGLGLNGSPVSASFGYEPGSQLHSLGLPLQEDRHYLYFSFTEGFQASFGTGPFSANTSVTRTVVIDPGDPSILFAGPMGLVNAVGLSEKGRIPYTPTTTWGFDMPEDYFPTFTGQSFVQGEVPLEEFPITVSGNVTTKYQGWDGTSALDKTLFGHAVGINGSLNLGWEFLDGVFTLEVPLAKASMYLETKGHPYRATVAVSGTAGTSTYLPSWIPVALGEDGYLAGYMDTADASKNHLDGAVTHTLKAADLGKQIGLPLVDLVLEEGTWHADRMGFRFNGVSNIGLTPQLISDSSTITACFGGDPVACLSDDQNGTPVMGSKDWVIRSEGSLTIANVPLTGTTVMASPKGISIESFYDTGIQKASMIGALTPGPKLSSPHVKLTGTASVSMRLNAANEILSAVVDGALCGYEEIVSAAKCGSSLTHFTDVFHCGRPHCSWSWRHGLRCDSISCSIKWPKTCDDLTHPKKCVPPGNSDFDLGSVEGTVSLTITEYGISGALTGTFCAAGGGCSSLKDVGTLDFSNIHRPKVCIDSKEIDGSLPLGKFCARF
ncbi:MAG: hypothetical protein SF187_04435 [Deltaproteobacteria bacterium]|nr:hypothetical protein [Deltaproteobacteria bacterium]